MNDESINPEIETLANDESINPEIETLANDESRISGETFCKLFDDHSQFDQFFIIDCRSSREYDGGHIKGAIRCNPFEGKTNIQDLYKKYYKPRSLYIFHCEYSLFRAPSARKLFEDEHSNSSNSKEPLNAFILDGGYRLFYPFHQNYCDGSYVSEFG